MTCPTYRAVVHTTQYFTGKQRFCYLTRSAVGLIRFYSPHSNEHNFEEAPGKIRFTLIISQEVTSYEGCYVIKI